MMFKYSKTYCGLLVTSLLTIFVPTTSLEGENVCEREETVNVTVKVAREVPYVVETREWCLWIPPSCKVNKTMYKTEYKDEVQSVNNTIEVCCPGYAELNGRCVDRVVQVRQYVLNQSSVETQTDSSETAGLFAGLDEEDAYYYSVQDLLVICMSISVLLFLTALFMVLKYRYKVRDLQNQLSAVYAKQEIPTSIRIVNDLKEPNNKQAIKEVVKEENLDETKNCDLEKGKCIE